MNAELAVFFPKKLVSAWVEHALGKPDFGMDMNAPQKAIADPIWDFVSRGGKRWRPALLLLACESLGGSRKAALPFTVIPELVHNGTIMIDDLEDNSSLRRGKPSTHLLFGVDVAVNAGNAMYYIPLVALLKDKKLAAEQKSRLYGIYALEMLRLSFGQATDIYWHKGGSNPKEGHYLQMCSYKTGSLARMAAEFGAVLGNGTRKQLNAFADFATSIGVAFQIQDDILNIMPEHVEWGKEIGDDIKEGKRTLMVIHALRELPATKKNRLLGILNSKEKSDADVKEAVALLDECGSVEYAKKIARVLVSESWARLGAVLPESKSKVLLKEFADYLIERNR